MLGAVNQLDLWVRICKRSSYASDRSALRPKRISLLTPSNFWVMRWRMALNDSEMRMKRRLGEAYLLKLPEYFDDVIHPSILARSLDSCNR